MQRYIPNFTKAVLKCKNQQILMQISQICQLLLCVLVCLLEVNISMIMLYMYTKKEWLKHGKLLKLLFTSWSCNWCQQILIFFVLLWKFFFVFLSLKCVFMHYFETWKTWKMAIFTRKLTLKTWKTWKTANWGRKKTWKMALFNLEKPGKWPPKVCGHPVTIDVTKLASQSERYLISEVACFWPLMD